MCINRFILIIMSVLILGCSTPLRVDNGSGGHVAEERQLSRKRLIAPSDIQPKSMPVVEDGIGVRVSLMDMSKEELPVLDLYRNPATRDGVMDFFVSLAGDEEVALTSLYYSDRFGLNPFLVFSLMYTESRFSPDAVNHNPRSIDRGLFQLNNRSFPNLSNDDFFNIDVNVRMGMRHLIWCHQQARGNEDLALAIYNAGFGRISTGSVPESTKSYVRNIKKYRSNLARKFRSYITDYFLVGASTESDKISLL